jgi:hypothetical protein
MVSSTYLTHLRPFLHFDERALTKNAALPGPFASYYPLSTRHPSLTASLINLAKSSRPLHNGHAWRIP